MKKVVDVRVPRAPAIVSRRRTPSRNTRDITCLLTIASDRSSRSAAATKLPDSTTCRKALRLVRVSTRLVYAVRGWLALTDMKRSVNNRCLVADETEG